MTATVVTRFGAGRRKRLTRARAIARFGRRKLYAPATQFLDNEGARAPVSVFLLIEYNETDVRITRVTTYTRDVTPSHARNYTHVYIYIPGT